MKPTRARFILLISAWVICGLVAGMTIRSAYRYDSLVWASQTQVKGAASAGNGWYAVSRAGDLQVGAESWLSWGAGGVPYCESAGRSPGISFLRQKRLGDGIIGDGFWEVNYTDSQPSYGPSQPSYTHHDRLIRIGWWLLFLAVLVPAAAMTLVIHYSRRRERRLVHLGYCRNCGYDLRATPHRCPECGAIPSIQ